MDMPFLLDLYDHMAWADAAVWSALWACDEARQDAVILGTLSHLHAVQRTYPRVWRGLPWEEPPHFEEISALLAWARSGHGEARTCLATLTDAQLGGPVADVWTQRWEQRMPGPSVGPVTIHDTVVQVPLHSLHHRGQVVARLDELGGAVPIVDYILWVWQGRPDPAWPVG